MNYDPIHDTYASSQSSVAEAEEEPKRRSQEAMVGLQSNIRHGDVGPEESPEPEAGVLPTNFRDTSRGFKYLKKSDGKPFWRRDIQHDFLHELFADNHRVFTNNFPFCEVANASNEPKLTFAELYVRTLADSSKSSRVLRERLIRDHDMGVAVSKVCLLVNAGRMNTTVNFVPDMRSALRTYHSIPSLQVDSAGGIRPLQDTPRLKTILKAVCDGQDHLSTLLEVLKNPSAQKPNTNVIKLIFLMSTFFQNIPFHYDDSYDHDTFSEKLRFIKASPGPQNKFMEFFLNDEIRPSNRARRFLWLMYTYLETSFTEEELAQNPFNASVIPPVEEIPPSEIGNYDIDTQAEVDYAAKMYHTRMMHLNGEAANTNPKRGNKSKRERQKIRKQLIMDHNYKPHEEEVEESEEEPHLDRLVKRKRPAPSVSSLVEDARRPLLDDEHQHVSPQFPIEGLESIKRRFVVAVPSPSPDDQLLLSERRNLVRRTKPLVAHLHRANPGLFESARHDVLSLMLQYFRAQKSRFLGVEWEDIRADVSAGIETYLYQQLGKELLLRHYDDTVEDEQLEHGDGDAIKRESFHTVAHALPGDLAPVDLSAIERLGAGYLPRRDCDRANEQSAFAYCLYELLESVAQKRPRHYEVRVDLRGETVMFT